MGSVLAAGGEGRVKDKSQVQMGRPRLRLKNNCVLPSLFFAIGSELGAGGEGRGE